MAVLHYSMQSMVHTARHTPIDAGEVEGAISQAIKNAACGHTGLTTQLDMAWTRAPRNRSSADTGEAPQASSTEPSLRCWSPRDVASFVFFPFRSALGGRPVVSCPPAGWGARAAGGSVRPLGPGGWVFGSVCSRWGALCGGGAVFV